MKRISLSQVIFYFSLFFPLVLTGCAPKEKAAQQWSEHYKQYHDYESLVALIPSLSYTMSRSDVENLLGEPSYCPTSAYCYYPSDKSIIVSCTDSDTASHQICQSFPLILVVNYDLATKTVTVPQDHLQSFHLFPVGE